MKVTPLVLEIFFHIYTTPGELPRKDSPGTKDTVLKLLRNDLICQKPAKMESEDSQYILTEKGLVWKDAILSTPLPVLQYVMPYPYNQAQKEQ